MRQPRQSKCSPACGIPAFVDEDGTEQLYQMGCYGIGVTRVVAAAIEQHYDDKGIVWPDAVAPWTVGLVTMRGDDGPSIAAADDIYAKLNAAGVETLYDDRDERGGVKLGSIADMAGDIPARVREARLGTNPDPGDESHERGQQRGDSSEPRRGRRSAQAATDRSAQRSGVGDHRDGKVVARAGIRRAGRGRGDLRSGGGDGGCALGRPCATALFHRCRKPESRSARGPGRPWRDCRSICC